MKSEQPAPVGLVQLVREHILPYNTLFALSGFVAVVFGMISPYLVVALGIALIATCGLLFVLDLAVRQRLGGWAHAEAKSFPRRMGKLLWHSPTSSLRMSGMFWTALIVGAAVTIFGMKGVYEQRRAERLLAATEAQAASAGAVKTGALPTIEADPSIAVLPLVNLSADKDQEYFSDGIADELLNLLTKVPKLRVIARTSSFSFKGQQVEVAEIARRLNVASVLEGTVRKSGNRTRITVQLVRASDSARIWSESYDKPMDDIFKVQDEIAAAVVAQLKVALLRDAPKSSPIDPAAFELILRADALSGQYTPKGSGEAIALYQRALAIDPQATRALSGLAGVYIFQANTGELSPVEGYRRARDAANRMLAIDPRNAAAHATLGLVASEHAGDMLTAAAEIERALDIEPANRLALRNAGRLLQYIGRFDEAIALRKYQVATDPASAGQRGNLAFAYLSAGKWDEAIASFRMALAMKPQSAQAHFMVGYALLAKGDTESALVEFKAEPSEVWRTQGLAMAYHALGRKAESDAALAALASKFEAQASYNVAEALAYRGETDRAFAWLEKADAYRDAGLTGLAVSPAFDSMRRDARWAPFLQKIGKAPDQLASVKFRFSVPRS